MALYVVTPERARGINFRDRTSLDYVADMAMLGAPVVGIHAAVRNLQDKMPDAVYNKRWQLATGAFLAGQLLRNYIDFKQNNPNIQSDGPLKFDASKFWSELKRNAALPFKKETPEEVKARLSRTVAPPDIALYNALIRSN